MVAERILTDAATRLPHAFEIRLALGQVIASGGRFAAALPQFRSAIELAPDSAKAHFLLGVTAARLERSVEAMSALTQAARLAPQDPQILAATADAIFRWGRAGEALPLYEALAKLRPDDAFHRLRAAESMSREGRFDDARAFLESSARDLPSSADVHMALGEVYEDLGRRVDARDAYSRALELNPGWALPLAGLLSVDRRDADPVRVEQARQFVFDERKADRDRAFLGYALGKSLDALGRHDEAADAWLAANAARRRYAPAYSAGDFAAYVEGVKRLHEDLPPTAPVSIAGDWKAVFIVGMPRSGTTLTEQILASHPAAHGAGELTEIGMLAREVREAPASASDPGWLHAARERWHDAARRGAKPGATVLVDKAPLNFLHLWLIERLFPESCIVWCQRDLRDVAVSIFGENFAVDSSFATRIDDILDYGRQQAQLMGHWKRSTRLRIHDLQYEALVRNPTDMSDALIESAGLAPAGAPLTYGGSDRPVATPSRWQVRQPIHTGSVGRWQRYAKLFSQD